MKIVCALSPKQVENLYKDVYKNMLNSLEADKAFNANDYMKKLFTQIAEKKDVATAMKFLQQVPGIMRAVGVKSQFDDLDISLDALKPLATNFKNEKDGFKNVLEYFKPEMSDKDKLELLVANQFISSLPTEVENPKEIKDPFRFRPFGWLSTTFQQLIQLNPNNKLRLLSEKPDANKNRIYNTIEKIQAKISAEEAVVTDGTLVVDGKVLKLTPVRLLDLYDTNQTDIDNTTTQDVIRTKSITNRPEGVETQNRIALVLSDEEGNYYHFTEEGDFTTKEEGGKIVYQFLRNVNKNAAGEYDALNQYGYGNQIQTPEMVAEKLEITVEEAKKLQQEELKQLYEVKQAVINNQKIKPLNVVELSAGVPESLAQKRISLKNLRSLPFVNNATFKTITPVKEKGSDVSAEIELNGKIYPVDKPDLSEVLIQKITSVLTNPKLSNKQKYDFVNQFLSDKASMKARRHTLLYNPGTDSLTFQYTEKTYSDGTGATYTLLNDQLNNKYDLIYDVLRYAKGDSRKGKPFPAKMTYNEDVLSRNAYRDYNLETGELSDEYNAPYIPLLETLDAADIKISESTDPGFYNTYIKFSIPSDISIDATEEPKVRSQYVGKIIYSTPGSGKTTLANTDENIIDTDELIVEEMNKRHPDFKQEANEPIQEFILRYVKKFDHKAEINNIVLNQARELAASGKTVLTGTMAFIKDADIVFRMNPASSRAIERFGSVEKAKDFAKKEKDEANKAKKKSIETKGIEQSIMTSFVSTPVTQTSKEERDNIIAPENTSTPNEGGLGSLFEDDKMYRSGKNLDLENITPEDIENAKKWWNNSPLSKFIDFKTMVNIVNSDVYAKFIAYGAVLNNKYGEIQISQRTSIVDVYHEAWHGFTQLFLTPTERKALYDEVAKQKGSFTLLDGTVVKFSEAKYRQLEEYLAEEFRTYAKEEGVKANSPIRNISFRRILNYLKNFFKSKSTKDKLFKELYLAGKNKKNSQKFLNKYTPIANTFNFKELNRGIEDVVEPTIDALDKQDSNLVSKSIDSFFSLTADQYSEQAGTKEATIRVFTNEKAKEKIYAEAKVDFQNKLDAAKEQLEEIQDDPAKALEIEKLQNKIRIFEAALKNWGDQKSGVIAYHNENSDYKIINKKFKEIKDEEEDDTTTQSQTANSKSVENTPQGETLGIKDDTQTKSLLDLASSETIVLLSSLHKIQDGKVVLNELGYPELADFASTWNNTIRAINGEKNPSKMLENIRAAAQTTYPEFKQLLRKFPGYTIEDGKIVINERNRFEVNTLSAFWQDFQKTRVTYLQTTVFDNNIAEVTKASIETMSLMRKFQAKFKSDVENKFIGRTAENVAFLKVAEVVAEFGKDGKLDSNRAYEFARAIGLYLDDLSIIKNELNLNQKAKQMYGLIYIYRNMYDIDQAMKNPKTTQKTADEINEFLLDPIGKLSSGFTAGTISEKAVRQKNTIDRILGLQAKYGFDSANFAVLNAEKNLVFEHIDDHTISYITYALNKMQNLSEAWTPGSEFEYMSYLNPLINSFTTRLGIINTMFDKNDTEDGVYNWAKRSGKSLQLFINSGTQVEAIEDGTNTTSLDARGKFLQELHSMLKGGMIEFMRHASKSASFGARIDGEGGILGGVGKGEDTRLWVDTDKFATGSAYEYLVKNHMIPYIAGELERINKFKTNRDLFKTYAGYNRELADGTMAGENFTAFDNVLTKDTKEEILAAVTNPNVRFEDYIKTNPDLYKKILDEVTTYFTDQAKDLQNYYNEAKYLSPDLLDKLAVFNLGQEKAEEVLISAYAVNSWVQNFETATLFYGDIVQYNHEKEEMHKRNSGATSGGLKIRTDQSIRNYLTGLNGKLSYAQAEGLETLAYTGKFNSAIIQDIVRESVYSPVIERELRKDYTERLKGKVPADKLSEEVEMRVAQDLKPYGKMEEGDGQGWITFDAYRNLKIASKQWSDIQEQLYLKIIKKEPVKYSDIIEAFPVYKLQNFGHLANTSLPVMAMHKFALAPLIPSMIKNSDLESLHKQMIKSNIQYVTFQTGSKVGSVTSEVNEEGQAVADKIYNDDEQKSLKTDIKFTPNTVYLEYLKDVTKVPVSYKNKTVFATQLRKLILSNLYRNGELTVKNQVLVKDYEDAVDAYGEFLKMELLNEIGYKFEDGKYIGNFKNFLELVQRELGRKNIPEHHIEFINMNPDNSLKTDLSFHLRADEIEKIIVSLIEKRLVRQKIKGEALVQVSSAMTNGIWDNQIQFDKADIEQVRKFMGTNNLPFYNYNKDRTSAMKVAIALQGDFVNLLNLDYKGEKIGTRERLNQAIKDDEWLNANDGANRKAITMIAVRIPVQGLNSMEYMEVYEFLDEAAGPIIIPPSEIVAKSGADFDVDKLTTFMPSLDKSGKFVESAISNERLQNLLDQNKDTEEGKQMNARLLSTQKAALENKLITSLSNILSLPENYASLVRPNATYLLKDKLADELEDKVTDYNRFKNYHNEDERLNAKGKKAISPTRVLEPLYNLHKHEANMIGKKVLGIVAIYNALHPVLNTLGAAMPKTYTYKKQKGRESRVLLPVNKTEDGRISLSDITTVDGDLISELYSQLMNGSVDVEKDAWIFFIQGNEEMIGLMAMLLKSGVPREHAIKFLSQPLVREYAKEQRLLKSSYSDLITDNSGIPRTRLSQSGQEIKIPDKEVAAARVLSKFIVDSKEAPKLVREEQKALNALIEKGNILNKDGQFDIKDLNEILDNPNDPKFRDHQIATLLHILELEKQFSGYQELMRLSNPDTAISKTLQQVLNRNVLLDEIENDSRVEGKVVKALRKESILSTFFDNQIVQDLVEPVFPLRNSKDISNIIINLIKTNGFQIVKRFGDTEMFISDIKNNMVNSVFQNYMVGYVQSEKDLLNIPSDILAKYFTKDVFFQNTGYSFAEDLFDIINTNPELKDKYSLLSQLSIPEVKDGQKILTLNNSRLLSKGNVAEQYYQNILDLADPNVSKVADPVKNKYISDMFRVLPLVAVYQNGVGYSRFGFNEILPFEDYVAIMNNAAVDFNNQTFEDKQRYMDRVFNISMNPRNKMFKNFVSAAFVSTTPTFEKKNRFTVIPQAGVKDAKAVIKASIATQFIGFGEGIVGKDGKRSSTQIYREQVGTLANTGKYSGTDVIFVSVPGLRGDAAIAKREQDKTIREAIKAIEAGATILVDNKAYTFDSKNTYNSGEKRLFQNLEAKGYNYSEITIDGVKIGTWSKSRTTQPTVQPVGEVKKGVSELFESKPELANIGTPEQYSEWINYLTTQGKLAGTNSTEILYHGSDSKLEKFSNVGAGTHFGTLKSAKERRNKAIIPVILNINNPVLFKDILADDVLKAADEFLKENGEYLEYGYRNEESGLLVYLHKQGKIDSDTLWDTLYSDRNTMMQILQNALGSNGYRYINEVEDKGSTSYVVFEPEQIYILGSKQDIEGFKNFVSTQPTQAPTSVKVEVEPNYYTSELLKANPDKIYVFGDNNQRQGKKGQAAIRDEANAMGISTKLRPSADEDAFMTDKELADNKAVIDSDIAKIKAAGKTVVFPKDGLGTGLAALKTKAPKTYAYLKQRLLEEFGFNNDTGTITTQPTQAPGLPGPETKINIYAGTGENAELSNFAERPVTLNGITFNTPEGAYQAMKIFFTNAVLLRTPASKENLEILEKLKTATGKKAKSLGRQIKDLSDATWDRDSSGIMKNILTLSFEQNPDALAKLLATGNATLTHTQDKTKWGTEFPRLLMEVRDELRATQPTGAPVNTVLENPFKNSQVKEKVYHVDKRKDLTEKTLVDDGTMVFPSGVFFTTERKYAETYAKAIGGIIYEAYVDVQDIAGLDKEEIQFYGRNPKAFFEDYPDVDSAIYESYDETDDKYGVVGAEILVFKPEQIKLIPTTQPKQGPEPGEQLDLFNQRSINPNQKFDKELAKKIQDKLEKLYPEIKLNISNTPVWEEGNNVLNQEQYNNQVNYRIKTVDILLTPKADQVFAKGIKNKWTLDKILTELQIPKNQKGLIEKVIETMPYFEGIPFNAQLAYGIVSTYNYTIEINTATRNFSEVLESYNPETGEVDVDFVDLDVDYVEEYDDEGYVIGLKPVLSEKGKEQLKEKPTQYYSNLTVPGGTNYTEQEVTTPGIVPNIKGHAQFATENGIGWFRSDDKVDGTSLGLTPAQLANMPEEDIAQFTESTKTRRILEVQSDYFQKLRNNFKFRGIPHNIIIPADNNGKKVYLINEEEVSASTYNKAFEDFIDAGGDNQFLALLHKGDNWVTFFVKSIIQDSAKKGYEKVLFPSGNTASKVEGHTTLEEFKKQKEDRIKELENKINKTYTKEDIKKFSMSDYMLDSVTDEQKIADVKENAQREIDQLKQELERVEGPEGFGALKPIYNFYENVMSNVLKKQGYTPTQVTDEYGNTWNEVTINQARDLQNVLLQKNEANKIIGQANIKAMTVLIDAVNQRQDTLPHEYAHHYIAWFRNTPIVQEGIKRFGSEEALVQAIGEQVVKQKGDAYNWWKKFTNFILNLLSDKQVLQVLTDSFLNRTNLNEFMYNEEMESQEIESETSQERQEKINTLNEPKFKNWFTNEATKNPDLDILDALDYYMKCKR